MCNLSEVMIERGLEQGREQERKVINTLNLLLINQNRFEDLKRAASDNEYQAKLIKELLENNTANKNEK